MSDGGSGAEGSRGVDGAEDLLAGLLAELRRREPEATDRLLDIAQEAVGVVRALLDVVARVIDEQRAAQDDVDGGPTASRVQRIHIGGDADAVTGTGPPVAGSGT